MNKKNIVLFFLAVLPVACTTVTPTTLPTATIPLISNAIPTQTSPHLFTPSPGIIQTQTSVPTPESTPTPLPGSDLILKRVAQTGGSICGITVIGDLAYIGMGPRVAVIDISRHESPQLVGQSEPLPGLVTEVLQISGEPATRLLVNAGKYLVLVDITIPGNIYPIRQLELTVAITAMVWDDRTNILYAGGSIYRTPTSLGYNGFVSAVDITLDNRLKLINTVTMPARVLSLALGKGSLFAGAEGEETGLYHIQVKTPGELSTPRLVIDSGPDAPLHPVTMQVIGERLYLRYRAIDAYDITNPDQPVRIWRVNTGIVVDGFNVVGDQIIAFGWTIRTEYMPDTITVPEPVEGSPVGVIASDTAMHNGDFLVAYNDFEIYDAANPQDPQLVGSYQAPVIHAIDAAANEKAIFVVDNGLAANNSDAILRGFSLPDLKPIGEAVIEFTHNWVDFKGIAVEGERVYIAKEDGLWVYDVSSSEPSLWGKIEIEDEKLEAIAAIKLGEKRLLFAAQSTEDHFNVLRVYDLTDLQKPTLLGSPLTLDQGWGLQMSLNGSAIYVLLERSYFSDSDMLYVIDYDNNVLELKGLLEMTGNIEHMAVDKKVILLAGSSELQSQLFVTVVESEPLKILSQTTLPEVGMGVAIIDDKALVVVGGQYGAAQLLTFDIQDPANPRQIEAMDIPISDNMRNLTILLQLPYVILANGAGGVEVEIK